MKRFISIILSLMIISALIPALSAAAGRSDTTIAYAVEGGNIYFDPESRTITGCDDGITSATIPSKINGITVTRIADYAFSSGGYSMKGVTIPDSVTSIGYRAFASCFSLESIYVYKNNLHYTSVDGVLFTKDMNELIEYPMKKSGTSYIAPYGVKSIGDSAFDDCRALESIILPYGVETICDRAFEDCGALESITLPESLTNIGNEAFFSCTALANLIIPDSVKSIGERALFNCSSLQSINIPHSVTSIGYRAFTYCSALSDINVDRDNQYYTRVDGVLYSKDMTELIRYPMGKIGTSYIVPEGVKSIGDTAFVHCEVLESITLPEGLTDICDEAFYGCKVLASMIIPGSVRIIGKDAFSGCSSLKSVTIPAGVASIGTPAFLGCSCLTGIEVDPANQNYTSIDGVLLNKDVSEIIRYPQTKAEFSYVIPKSVTKIGEYAFFGCSSLQGIALPEGVTKIGESAFSRCASLKLITIPDGVTEIAPDLFSFCKSLQSITLPDSVTEIGDDAFYGCRSLRSVTMGKGVKSIGSRAFEACIVLPDIVIPEGVTSIGDGAFYDCRDLKSVTIPSSVKSIDNDAFNGAHSLHEVFYGGTIDEWKALSLNIGKYYLLDVKIHYNYKVSEEPEDEAPPETSGSAGIIRQLLLQISERLTD